MTARRMQVFASILAVCAVTGATACAGARRDGGADILLTTAYGLEAEVQLSELTRHPRGFLYKDILIGDGASAGAGRMVAVSYVVRLADGREVDRAEPERPLRFRVGDQQMIAAVDAAVREMRAGGVRQLVIPPRLGYGGRGRGPVPGNAVLVMILRLEQVG